MTKETLIAKIEKEIQAAYETSPSVERAEQLAGEFLFYQMRISSLLMAGDLDARMKKSGTKALRAAGYMNAVAGSDKKPTEATISSILDTDETILAQQSMLDAAEAERDELKRIFDVCAQAHVHYRQLAKGVFGS